MIEVHSLIHESTHPFQRGIRCFKDLDLALSWIKFDMELTMKKHPDIKLTYSIIKRRK